MSDCITTFFDAWQIEEAELRLSKVSRSVTETEQYDDPRTPETLNGIAALNNYIGMFSANAPGRVTPWRKALKNGCKPH